MANHETDTLQILICDRSGRAAKTVTLDPRGRPVLSGYNAGKRFTPRYVPVGCLGELATALDSLMPLSHCVIIRGTLRDDVVARLGEDQNATVERRMVGPTAAFEPAARRRLTLALDAIRAPAGTAWRSQAGAP